MRYMRPWNLTDNFTKLPDQLLSYSGLPLDAKIVWSCLSKMSNGRTYCFPRIPTIAERLQISEDSVGRAIAKLVEQNFLIKIRRGRGKSNVYHFIDHPIFHDLYASAPDIITEDPDMAEEDPFESANPEKPQNAGSVVERQIVDRLLESSSRSALPPGRKPPQREEEDLEPLKQAIETYAPADVAILRKIADVALAADPELTPAAIAILVHWCVPKDMPVKSAGYWLKAIPKFTESGHFKAIRALLLPRTPWREKWNWAEACIRNAPKSDPDRHYAELWRQYWDHARDPTRDADRAQEAG
jgi:hypothetical protein